MAGIGWSLAAFLSTPQFYVFHTYYNTDPGPYENMTLCESIWRLRPLIERKIYLCFVPLVVFVAPFCIITFCYIRIFLKIAEKANEGRSQVIKPGKVHLQSTPSSSLPKAKIKTLKMTCVIVSVFLICGLPYFILEMIYNFGDHTMIPGNVAAILGSMAVANSAANPWVFLLFNVNLKCLQFAFGNCFSLEKCLGMDFNARRGVYDSTRTDYTSMDVKDSTRANLKHDVNAANSKEVMEMSYKAKATAAKPNVHYTRMSTAH